MESRTSITRCLATLGGAVVVAAAFGVFVVLAAILFLSRVDKANPAPATGDRPLRIAAVGDSYMSGEGAAAFFPGTDRPGRNQCRRTATSYPFLVARMLEPPAGYDGVSLESVACSGAMTLNLAPFTGVPCTEDLFPDSCPAPQYAYTPDGRYAPAFQIDRIDPASDVVLVSVGGNDSQFGDVVALCTGTAQSCRPMVDPWLETLDGIVQWRLRAVYRAVRERAPDAEIFAVTYPNPLYRESCGRTHLDQDETSFLTEWFIPRLNDQIDLAAAAEGVHTIDLADVFAGHRLCQPEGPDGAKPEIAVNAFQIKPVRGLTWKPSTWFHGSFHPNEYGHRLIAERVAREIGAVLAGDRSSPGGVVPPDFEDDGVPPNLPPLSGYLAGPPQAARYETGSACGTQVVETVTVPRPAGPKLGIDGVDPATTVCYRPLIGAWRSTPASQARIEVPLEGRDVDGFAGWHEVLYRSDGAWIRLVVVAPAGDGSASLSLARAWLWPWVITTAGIVAHPLIYSTLIVLAIGGMLMRCTRRRSAPEGRSPAGGRWR